MSCKLLICLYVCALRLRRSEPVVSDSCSVKSLAYIQTYEQLAGHRLDCFPGKNKNSQDAVWRVCIWENRKYMVEIYCMENISQNAGAGWMELM